MFNDPYCTVQEADSVNTRDEWLLLTDDEKLLALKWGRLYIDGNYRIVSGIGTTELTDALKLANALLGQYHSVSSLFTVTNPPSTAIAEKKVKAGSVEVSKKYATGTSVKTFADPYPDVSAALAPFCSRVTGSFQIRTVVRA